MPLRPTARDLGIPFDGEPGPYNAITDVPGVEVGHTTIIKGEGPLVIGKGPVRTGVTAILPLGRQNLGPVPAAWFPFNGNGEMTGTTWIEESGFLEGPILLTNTTSVGTVRDAVIKWLVKQHQAASRFNPNDFSFSLPVVAETWDGWLNDAFGFHITEADVVHALETAAGGPVAQGNVGGGTGMVCYDFKGGIGTASRVVRGLSPFAMPGEQKGTVPLSKIGGQGSEVGGWESGLGSQVSGQSVAGSLASRSPDDYVVGVLVQANHGKRPDLLIRGVPVGRELPLSEIPRGDARGLSPFVESSEQKGTVPFSSKAGVAGAGHVSSPSPLACEPVERTGEGQPAVNSPNGGEGEVGGRKPEVGDRGSENGSEAAAFPSPEPLVPSPFSSRSGSILIIIATNAPLLPYQLKRLARRATLGLARTGTIGNNDSGDIFLAFSTAWGPFAERGPSPIATPGEQTGTVPFSARAISPSPLKGEGRGECEVGSRRSEVGGQQSEIGTQTSEAGGESAASPDPWPLAPSPSVGNDALDPFFSATVEATEEAILNALLAAETLTGRDHHTAPVLPHDRLQKIMRKFNRLEV
jgi:L-aminopeptidase/D-esterase-like protein